MSFMRGTSAKHKLRSCLFKAVPAEEGGIAEDESGHERIEEMEEDEEEDDDDDDDDEDDDDDDDEDDDDDDEDDEDDHDDDDDDDDEDLSYNFPVSWPQACC
jgi:hypothetical protein